MKHFSKSSTNIEIRLNEEKFYFPGQVIEGVVYVHPKNPTKANHIRLTFTGEVFLAIKEKETINLFTITNDLPMSQSGKTQILEAKQHEFPFKFIVQDDLPSTFQFRKPKAWIKYTLTAILDRPMIMGPLSAKATYTVQILELIDVDSHEFSIPREQNLDFSLPHSKPGQQCHLKVTMPKIGYTRGDVVRLGILLTHYEPTVRKEAVKVELMRMTGIQTSRNIHNGEETLKTLWHDINIGSPFNFIQSFDTQIPIPTSTPPSIQYKGMAVQIYYRIRISIFLNNGLKAKTESHRVDMPIIVGTWPKADVPIDDEDDEPMQGETTDEEDDVPNSPYSLPQPTPSRSTSVQPPSQQRRSTASSIFLPGTFPTVSSITIDGRNIATTTTPGNTTVARSDSNVSRSSNRSRDSIGSQRSSQSYYNNTRSPTLSFTTLGSTNLTSPESLYNPTATVHSSSTNNNTLNPPTHHLSRSTSTPDLVNIPPPVSNITYSNTNATIAAHRSSFYDPPSTTTTFNNSNGNNVVSLQPVFAQPPAQHHARVTSMEFTSKPTAPMTTVGKTVAAANIQPRVLQPIPNHHVTSMYHMTQYHTTTTGVPPSSMSQPTVTNLVPRVHHPRSDGFASFEGSDSDPDPSAARNGGGISSSEDSDDEGDLLRIIERKKKQEERAKRSGYRQHLH